jgi:hypothetical protein
MLILSASSGNIIKRIDKSVDGSQITISNEENPHIRVVEATEQGPRMIYSFIAIHDEQRENQRDYFPHFLQTVDPLSVLGPSLSDHSYRNMQYMLPHPLQHP